MSTSEELQELVDPPGYTRLFGAGDLHPAVLAKVAEAQAHAKVVEGRRRVAAERVHAQAAAAGAALAAAGLLTLARSVPRTAGHWQRYSGGAWGARTVMGELRHLERLALRVVADPPELREVFVQLAEDRGSVAAWDSRLYHVARLLVPAP